MIFFLSTRRNRYPMDRYLGSWGRSLRELIQPISYETFLDFDRFLPGVYFFADLELLGDEQRKRAEEVWEQLSTRGGDFRVFNHPGRSLLRYDLLKKLHREGINQFTVYRAHEDLSAVRYPAFIRIENDHQGFRVAPLPDEVQLRQALESVRTSSPAGMEWLVTEFCDTSGADGLFRKFSAFMLDGTIVPRHQFVGRNWCLKVADVENETLFESEREYIRTNPHEAELRRVFALAGIDYGRVDYGLLDGRIQIWEINTNPMIVSFSSRRQTSRLDIHSIFAERFAKVWHALGETPPAKRRENYRGQRLSASLYRLRERPAVRGLLRTASRLSRRFR